MEVRSTNWRHSFPRRVGAVSLSLAVWFILAGGCARDMDPALGRILDGLAGRSKLEMWVDELSALFKRQNLRPADYLNITGTDDPFTRAQAKLIITDEGALVCLMLMQEIWQIPGVDSTRLILFDGKGAVIDKLEVNCDTRVGTIEGKYLALQPVDLATIQFNAQHAELLPDAGFEIRHKGRMEHVSRKKGNWPADWLANGICRVRVEKGAFHILSPILTR